MGDKLNKLVSLQVLHYFSLGFVMFIAYDIWKISETVGFFFTYYLLFTLYRLIAIPIMAWMVLRDKLKELLMLSFIISLLMAVMVYFVTGKISNPVYMLHLYALPLAFFTSFYQMGISQIIAQEGKERNFERFFYLTGLWRNIVDVALPILLGLIITYISYKASFVLMGIFSVYSMYAVYKMERISTGFNGETFKDIFKKVETVIPKRIGMVHYVFIFASGMLLQYIDMAVSSYQFTLGSSELHIGILKSLFVVAIFIVFKIKAKDWVPDSVWYYGSLLIFAGVILLETFTSSVQVDFYILFLLVILLYTLNSSTTSMSFKLMDESNNFGKFAILVKREIVRTVSKTLITLVGLFWTIENMDSVEYTMYSLSTLAVVVITFITYRDMAKYLAEREVEEEK